MWYPFSFIASGGIATMSSWILRIPPNSSRRSCCNTSLDLFRNRLLFASVHSETPVWMCTMHGMYLSVHRSKACNACVEWASLAALTKFDFWIFTLSSDISKVRWGGSWRMGRSYSYSAKLLGSSQDQRCWITVWYFVQTWCTSLTYYIHLWKGVSFVTDMDKHRMFFRIIS